MPAAKKKPTSKAPASKRASAKPPALNATDAPVRRSRGRPPHTQADTQAVRDSIRQVTEKVYAEHGYHGLTVELILKEGGFSRPTFYRYYNNTDEVLEVILKDVNAQLVQGVLSAIRSEDNPLLQVEAGLLAFRHWVDHAGPTVRAIFTELHDRHSPASVHRQGVLDEFSAELQRVAKAIGRKPFSPYQLETFVIGVEYLGYRYRFGPEGPTDEAWKQARDAMFRLALGLLGSSLEWGMAPQIAAMFQFSLD
jgi:TetR/AcrR family transcriptional regulator